MENNKRYIDQGAITVIAELDPNHDRKELEALFEQINSDESGGGVIDFDKIGSLHFLRWFFIDEARLSDGKGGFSDKNPYPKSLAFTSNFDGSIEEHLGEILKVAKKGIVKIYSYCKDFPSNPSDAQIIAYFKERAAYNPLFWPAIRGGTVEQLKGEQEVRDTIQSYLDQCQQKGSLKGKTQEQVKQMIVDHIKGIPKLSWALVPRAKQSFSWRVKYYASFVWRFAIALIILPWLLVWWALSYIMNARDDKYRKPIVRSQDFEELLKNEDRDFMNQLTVYASLKKPYWFRITQLRMGLWLFAINGIYRSYKGRLAGMETIHFARWTFFNKKRNVMFLSNFDGPWEIYLNEFIDRSASAMNLTFGTTEGYPKVKGLFGEGAHKERAFKTVVRNNQYPCQVWYSAYPRLTIKNIRNNQEIRKGLAGVSEETTQQWLTRLY